ncbi:hypothetical protein Ancab_025526 [Ancistrocladus abbreviatus]
MEPQLMHSQSTVTKLIFIFPSEIPAIKDQEKVLLLTEAIPQNFGPFKNISPIAFQIRKRKLTLKQLCVNMENIDEKELEERVRLDISRKSANPNSLADCCEEIILLESRPSIDDRHLEGGNGTASSRGVGRPENPLKGYKGTLRHPPPPPTPTPLYRFLQTRALMLKFRHQICVGCNRMLRRVGEEITTGDLDTTEGVLGTFDTR